MRHSQYTIITGSLLALLCSSMFAEIIPPSSQTVLPEQKAIALYTPNPPKIDGSVDRIWLDAPENGQFVQRVPLQGAKATHDTRFYVLYDEDNIYFLFVMLDANPSAIPARLLERDQRFSPDDNINFYLDTYNDHRKAFFFSTNPAGVEQDGLISENGNNLDLSWDTIFKVAARRNDFGWVAEFAIPFTSIRFTDDLRYQVWGFNVWRIHKENREVNFWSLVDQNYQVLRLDKGGVLIGMQNIHQGQNLSLLPYITTRNITSPDSRETDAEAGIDIKYGLTSDLTMDLTINSDFGQVEIDQEQINLDKRYEIQLDEKRPFFLENTNLFQTPFYQLFYSRRIGLDNQIKAGGKLTGKIDRFSLGVLGAYTGDWDNYGLGDHNKEPADELFSVVRVQGDVLANSNLGLMYIGREANLASDRYRDREYNRAGGVDFVVHSGQLYMLGQGVYAYNSDSIQTVTGTGVFGQTGYYGRFFRLDAFAMHHTPDFDLNKVGYFQKLANKGTSQAGLYLDVHPIHNHGLLREWGISIEPILRKDSDENTAGGGIESAAWIELRDESKLKFGFTRYRDSEVDKFNLHFGRSNQTELIYWGRDLFCEINTDEAKPVSLKIRGNMDSQYYFQTHSTGMNRGLEVLLRLKPRSNSFLEIEFQSRQFLDDEGILMPGQKVGQPEVQIWNVSSRYLFSRFIFSRLYLQYTNGAEDFSRDPSGQYIFPLQYEFWDRLSGNILLGWRFRPGSTLYLAYTEEWDQRNIPDFKSCNRILFFKLSYLWSL